MPRTILPIDIFESNMASHIVPLPTGATFVGMAPDPKNPDCIHLWFDGFSADMYPIQVQFLIRKPNEPVEKEAVLLGSIMRDDGTSRHVFRAKFMPKCICGCATGGDCHHEWNGPWANFNTTCTTCGTKLSEHGTPRPRVSQHPRLRVKSNNQKDDCLFCDDNPSTHEVIFQISQIRVCGNPECIDKAVDLAKKQADVTFP